jgi:iron complex outermembrane receptor protein
MRPGAGLGGLALGLMLGAAPVAMAQHAPPPAALGARGPRVVVPPPDAPQEVVVTAKREPGAVIGDIKPELQLTAEDIQSYGVSSVAELLDELAPQTRSDRGRGGEAPVVLLNGHRISGFNEIRDIPTEAILRVDILPEEVALKYGYTANQRVVNIVLKPVFHATTVEAGLSAPTEGGQVRGQGEGDLFHLKDDDRLNIDVRLNGASALTDHDRHITEPTSNFDLLGNVISPTPGAQIDPALSARAGQPVTIAGVPAVAATRAPTLNDFAATANIPNTTDVSRDRTLVPETKALTVNSVLSRSGVYGAKVTLNGTLGATTSDATEGLPGVSLLVPAGDPFSPFSQPVAVQRYDNAFGPLRQTTDGWTGHLGLTVNKDLTEWRFSLTGAYDHADTLTTSDAGLDPSRFQSLLNVASAQANPFAPLPPGSITELPDNKARSLSDGANIQLLASGTAFKVPAGNLFTSLKIGDAVSNFDGRSLRQGFSQASHFDRNDANAQANFDLPLASAKKNVLPMFGEVSLNGNLAVNELSDFGTLVTYGYGVNWTPLPWLNLILSQTHDEAAPSQQQLGNPLVATVGQRVFDYSTGQTVTVTSLSGGNPALIADSRTVSKIGLTLKPFASQDFTVTANYIASDIKNPIASFPAATAEIEAAFPDRFTRNSAGQLTQIDYRPVNFADQRRSEIRWGFNFAMPVGGPPPSQQRQRPGGFQRPLGAPLGGQPGAAPSDGDATPGAGGDDNAGPTLPQARRAPGGGGFGGGFGGGRGGRGGGGGFGGNRGGQRPGANTGRFQVAVYHTVFFTDEILVRKGVVFDLLNGSAAGNSGGQPRNEVEAQLGYTQSGYGARLSADWKQGTTVRGGAQSSTGDLNFSDIATVSLRLFVSFDLQPELLKRWPVLKGSRLTLSATNLFDQRVSVHDANGATPISYQPAYLDPVGRVVGIGFRKVFE